MADGLLWSGMVKGKEKTCVRLPSLESRRFEFDPSFLSLPHAISTRL